MTDAQNLAIGFALWNFIPALISVIVYSRYRPSWRAFVGQPVLFIASAVFIWGAFESGSLGAFINAFIIVYFVGFGLLAIWIDGHFEEWNLRGSTGEGLLSGLFLWPIFLPLYALIWIYTALRDRSLPRKLTRGIAFKRPKPAAAPSWKEVAKEE